MSKDNGRIDATVKVITKSPESGITSVFMVGEIEPIVVGGPLKIWTQAWGTDSGTRYIETSPIQMLQHNKARPGWMRIDTKSGGIYEVQITEYIPQKVGP